MSTPRSHSANSSSVLDAYPVRIMLGLVASLGLMLALVRLPLQAPLQRVGWSAHAPADQIVLENVTPERSETKQSEDAARKRERVPPVTDLRSLNPEPPASSTSSESSGAESTERQSDGSETYEEVQSIAELGLADRTPQIVGGVGSLYLQINYPEKALQNGIEGELELEFTVERDGRVTDMEVVNSLHPLCDSAAVKGVRSVQFVPATHDGTPVSIRLRLPVEFRIDEASSPPLSKGADP